MLGQAQRHPRPSKSLGGVQSVQNSRNRRASTGHKSTETVQVSGMAGKPPEGRLRLRATLAGGELCLEIDDDGAGVDLPALRRALSLAPSTQRGAKL
jgi:hypothetical protein